VQGWTESAYPQDGMASVACIEGVGILYFNRVCKVMLTLYARHTFLMPVSMVLSVYCSDGISLIPSGQSL
jgi:hypothetical protein